MRIITVFFVSGEKFEFQISDSDIINFTKKLKEMWSETASFGDGYGINFHHVTHFVIEK